MKINQKRLPENTIERFFSPARGVNETRLFSNFRATLMNFTLLFTLGLLAGCSLFQAEKDDKPESNLLTLLSSSTSENLNVSRSNREMYNGFADIPASIYKPVGSNVSSSSTSRTLATTDYRFVNSTNTASVGNVYDLVRATANSTRDIAKSIGDMVKALEVVSVSTTITGSNTWGGVASKYRYRTSSILTNGKKLEVWWNNGVAPYNNNKAMELEFTGVSTGSSSGFVYVRFLPFSTATSLSKAYFNFNYNATTNIRAMVVILQDIGPNYNDNAHFFVLEANGITTIDGVYTVKGYNANATGTATGVNAAPRAYVFSAIGDVNKAVVRAAFPLTTDSTTALYANTPSTGAIGLANIGQVWTNFILANSTTVTAVNSFGGVCGSSFIKTTPNAGNPTSFTDVTTVASLKTCLDSIITAQSSTDSVKDIYFLTNIKNPAYFSVVGTSVSLYGVESLDVTDINKSAFDALENNSAFLSSTRTSANTTYSTNLDAVSVTATNLFTGAGIPVGASAINLTNLNAQWGNGVPGNGTSSATAGTNTVNGTVDNTAPF